MATNNPFNKNIVYTGPPPPNASYPKTTILDPFAESVIEYALDYGDFTSLENIYIVANQTTIGGALTIYLPVLPAIITEPRKVTIINMGLDIVQIENATGAAINWDTSYIINLDPYAAPPVSNTVSSVTLIPDTQVTPSWYTLYNYYNI